MSRELPGPVPIDPHRRSRGRVALLVVSATLVLSLATSAFLSASNPFKLQTKQGNLVVVPDESGVEPILKVGSTGQLRNQGENAVRVLAVESTCGCAAASVRPELVQPGGEAIVEIETTPMDVGVRRGVITIKTDSSKTPSVALGFLVEGNRQAPHLLSAAGEIIYRSDSSRDESRTLSVEIVEPRTSTPKVATIRCSLPFVRVCAPKRELFEHATRKAWVVRKYTYQVNLDVPPTSEFAGELAITHDDDPERTLHVRVVGEPWSPFRVTPRHLGVRLGIPARLIVKVTSGAGNIRVAAADGRQDSWVVRPIATDAPDLRAFEVEPGSAGLTRGEIAVTLDGSPDRVIVPVRIEEPTP